MPNKYTRPNMLSLGLLLHLVYQHKERLLTQAFLELDITPSQFRVLATISYKNCRSPAEISKAISIDGGSMSRMFERLEKKSLIKRLPNPDDKRSVILELTTQGNEMLDKCYQIASSDVNEKLIGDLSSEELEQLFSLLKRVGNIQ